MKQFGSAFTYIICLYICLGITGGVTKLIVRIIKTLLNPQKCNTKKLLPDQTEEE